MQRRIGLDGNQFDFWIELAQPAARADGEQRFGRVREKADLRAAIDRLPTRGGVVILSGEAGIGKSTMLRWLREESLWRRPRLSSAR